MSEQRKIEKGDIVTVNINNARMTLVSRGRVEYIPCATGDSWVFTDLEDGDTVYVSEGCTIIRRSKDNESI